MKKLIFLSLAAILFSTTTINAENRMATESVSTEIIGEETSEVQVYYFHGTHRCKTCLAIEEVAKEAIFEYYGSKGELVSINWEENEDDPTVQKYEVAGQALLIVHEDQVVDLTNDAFLNALSNRDELKEEIKSTIANID